MDWKIIIKQSIIIIIVSLALALLFYLYTDKRIPLIFEKKQIEEVSDSSLETLLGIHTDTTQQINSMQTVKAFVDTLSVEKKIDTTGNTNTKTHDNLPLSADEVKTITYTQLLKYLNNPNIILIDARDPESFAKGKIGNAINLFPEAPHLEQNYYPKIDKLDRNKLIIVYCNGVECDLGHMVLKDLIIAGFQKMLLYVGGWDEWELKQKESKN